MRWILLAFSLPIIFSMGCASNGSADKDEVEQPFDNYKEITMKCENFRLLTNQEWEERGFVVKNNIATSSETELDITKEKRCTDNNLSERCREECSKMKGTLDGVRTKLDTIICGCTIE